jgi:hypothetical protein
MIRVLLAFILVYGLFLISLSVLAQSQIDRDQRQIDYITNKLDSINAALESVK